MTNHEEYHPHVSLKSYIWGFTLSLLLTLAAYFAVTAQLLPHTPLLYTIFTLALIQFGVQMVLFLHLGEEKKPYWHFLTFLFMIAILLIVVIGSLWIMNHLNYNTMPDMATLKLKEAGSP